MTVSSEVGASNDLQGIAQLDIIAAGLRYLAAGVGPLVPLVGKDPSRYGTDWQKRGITEPDEWTRVVASDSRYTNIGWVQGHGTVALDFDYPDKAGEELLAVARQGAKNPTRKGRGHRIFATEEVYGSSTAGFPTQGWGEARGKAAQIVIWGQHPEDPDAFYSYDETQTIPPAPPELLGWLSGAATHADPAKVAELETALEEHTEALYPPALEGLRTRLAHVAEVLTGRADDDKVKAARHDNLIDLTCWASREALAGLYSLEDARDLIASWWRNLELPAHRAEVALAKNEYTAAWCWALAQAKADPARVARTRAEATQRAADERLPANVDPEPDEDHPGSLGKGDEHDDLGEYGFDHPLTGKRITGKPAEMVLNEAGKIETRNLARLVVNEREFVPPPVPHTIQWHREHPPEQTKDRIERILQVGARATIVSPRKTGKTTLTINVARSLTTGEKLFNRWWVRPCRVHVLNYEVTGYQFATWCDEAGVGDGLLVSSLRGVSNPLATARGRRELARQICDGGAEVLIVDPYSAASVGCVEREGDNVAHRTFLAHLDELANDAGCTELIVPMHASLKADDPDSTRGGTALEDWPDAIWRLSQDDHGERFFSAMGRDVDVPEDRLTYNESNRRLSFGMARVGKRDAKAERGREAVVRIVRRNPGITTSDLRESLRSEVSGFGNDTAVNTLLKSMDGTDIVRRSEGVGKPTHHYLPGAEEVPE